MAERQLSWMSRLSPKAFQFADTLGTTILCSSNKDGFQPSRAVPSAKEEKAVVDPVSKYTKKPFTIYGDNNQLLYVTSIYT